jgi:hypothetical protein
VIQLIGAELILHLRFKESDSHRGAGAVLPTPRASSNTATVVPSEVGVRVAEVSYKVVAELEFTSARRRMSVVVQGPDGTYVHHIITDTPHSCNHL